MIQVTLGRDGALATVKDGPCYKQGTKVLSNDMIVDATGAGDAFIAGFLMAWLGTGGKDVGGSLRWGCGNGAAVVQRAGAAQQIPVGELLPGLPPLGESSTPAAL